jgi:hypothetical protein
VPACGKRCPTDASATAVAVGNPEKHTKPGPRATPKRVEVCPGSFSSDVPGSIPTGLPVRRDRGGTQRDRINAAGLPTATPGQTMTPPPSHHGVSIDLLLEAGPVRSRRTTVDGARACRRACCRMATRWLPRKPKAKAPAWRTRSKTASRPTRSRRSSRPPT